MKKSKNSYMVALALSAFFLVIGLTEDDPSGVWILGAIMFALGLYLFYQNKPPVEEEPIEPEK